MRRRSCRSWWSRWALPTYCWIGPTWLCAILLGATWLGACRPTGTPLEDPGSATPSAPEDAAPAEPAPASPVDAVSSEPATDLFAAEAERTLAPDEIHAYRFTLHQNEALKLVVEQDGIDLALLLFDGDGRLLGHIDGPGGPFGPELLARVAPADETLRLEVRPHDTAVEAGRYHLQRFPVRPATAVDRARTAALEAHRMGDQQTTAHPEEALLNYRRAAELWRQADEVRLQARALRRLGQLHARQDFVAAVELFSRSQELLQQLDKGWEWVGLHNDLGGALRGVGDIAGAEAAYLEAERVGALRGDRAGLATAINNLGLVAQAGGRNEDALRRYREAVRLFTALGNATSAEVATVNLGMVLAALGRYDEAERLLRQALSSAQQQDDPEQRTSNLDRQANLLSSLGWIASLRRDDLQAITLYNASLALRQEGTDPHRLAVTYMLRGQSRTRQGKSQLAQRDIERALELQRQTGDRLGEAYGRAFLGNLLLDDGPADDDLEGEEHLRLATDIFQQMGDARGLAGIDLSRARWQRRRGHLEAARQHMEQAIERLQSLRGRLLSPAFRRSVSAADHLDLSAYVDLLIDWHRVDPTAGHDREAFEAAESFRGQSLGEELGLGSDWRLRASTDLIAQQGRALEDLQAAEMERIDLARLNPDDPNLPLLEANIQAKLVEQARLESDIRRSAGLAEEDLATVARLEDLQTGLLDQQTTLLAFHIAPNREHSVAWVVRRTEVSIFPLDIEAATAETLVGGAIDAFEKDGHPLASQRATRDLAELSRRLLPPSVVQDLRGSQLLVVPDGALALLPLGLLSLPDAGTLGDAFDLVHVPSATVWSELQRRRTRRAAAETTPPSRPLAMIGGARYPTSVRQRADATTTRDAARQHFGPLPGSRREADSILRLFGDDALALLGHQATRTNVRATPLNNVRIVHFATHGLLEMGRPELSAIVLSLEDTQGQPIDGFLRVTDLERLTLRADLVVVSACRTGRGEAIEGEGIFGIAHALFRAGAQSLVVSHWAVDDRATAELMPRFYQELLAGHSPAAALRRAQQRLRDETHWQDPVYWAAFSVQGDGFEPLF